MIKRCIWWGSLCCSTWETFLGCIFQGKLLERAEPAFNPLIKKWINQPAVCIAPARLRCCQMGKGRACPCLLMSTWRPRGMLRSQPIGEATRKNTSSLFFFSPLQSQSDVQECAKVCVSGCILIVLSNAGIKSKYWDSLHHREYHDDMSPLLKGTSLYSHFIKGLFFKLWPMNASVVSLKLNNVACVKWTLFTQSFNSLLRVHPFPPSEYCCKAALKNPEQAKPENRLTFKWKDDVDTNTLLSSATSWSTQRCGEILELMRRQCSAFMQTLNQRHTTLWSVKEAFVVAC